ncbi:AcrR family transcriptional regulator [Rhizobium sp. BK313]|uniref:TetR/AcrR family transcriptional regulator n=1 Tax=Rhizobium sp. BK313 TaxID=2587081 RepID=UPI00105C6399|nr:TetR/AcrR family transcriptional regulator [Rhizobium sp. BK313]MBB3459339.1 AcrR family transcriptional regulator [Rhizobium sp. BK313]
MKIRNEAQSPMGSVKKPEVSKVDVVSKTRSKPVRSSERLPFEQRREMILKKAVDVFAERGFDATTRDLARHLGTTQPLMYKYFKTKDDLIQEVYRRVFLDVWDTAWDEILVDRSRPITERLIQFYRSYTDVIMNRGWMRIYLFAGLKNVGITSSYIRLVEERVIRRIAMEICAAHGIQISKSSEARYMELAWSLQGSIFYYGVRKYAYELDPSVPRTVVIDDVVKIFVASWPKDNENSSP